MAWWIILIAALVVVAVLIALVKPRDRARAGDPYFAKLDGALKEAEIGAARIVIDADRLRHNIGVILSNLPSPDHYRIVVKSLPSLDLLRFIQSTVGTRKLMVVHWPFLKTILGSFDPGADVLMGKPTPVFGLKAFYQEIPSGGSARRRISNGSSIRRRGWTNTWRMRARMT